MVRTLDLGLDPMSPFDLGWVAGLVEGEGYIGVIRNKRKRFIYPTVVVVMTDRDVLDNLARVVGHGHVRRRTSAQLRANPHYKPQFAWQLVGSKAGILLRQIQLWMGQRRAARIDEVLDECATVRREQEALAA